MIAWQDWGDLADAVMEKGNARRSGLDLKRERNYLIGQRPRRGGTDHFPINTFQGSSTSPSPTFSKVGRS